MTNAVEPLSPEVERRLIWEIQIIDYAGKWPEDAPLDVEWVKAQYNDSQFHPRPLCLYEDVEGERVWAQVGDNVIRGPETGGTLRKVQTYFVLGAGGWPRYWPVQDFEARYKPVGDRVRREGGNVFIEGKGE